jgi:hypothetical protein
MTRLQSASDNRWWRSGHGQAGIAGQRRERDGVDHGGAADRAAQLEIMTTLGADTDPRLDRGRLDELGQARSWHRPRGAG